MNGERPDPARDYLCFSLDHDEDKAAQRFVEKFGSPPERIIEYKRG